MVRDDPEVSDFWQRFDDTDGELDTEKKSLCKQMVLITMLVMLMLLFLMLILMFELVLNTENQAFLY